MQEKHAFVKCVHIRTVTKARMCEISVVLRNTHYTVQKEDRVYTHTSEMIGHSLQMLGDMDID